MTLKYFPKGTVILAAGRRSRKRSVSSRRVR
jgi:hypothetical protein